MQGLPELAIEMLKQLIASNWWLQPSAQSGIGDYVFFQMINKFLQSEIDEFGVRLLARMMTWVGGIALTMMTLWIMIQGYRIATGQSRESMMALVTNALRATFIVGVATGTAIGGSSIFNFLANDVTNEIAYVVTGSSDNLYESIDKNLAYMQIAMGSIDAIQVAGEETLDSAKTRALWFAGFGTGGPAMTAGAMLLLNKIAMALFVGLGPLFILCLLFEQTKSMFSRWLFYGVGTIFSLAVLSMLVALSLKMVAAVAISFWVTKMATGLIGADLTEGVSSMALQQGGMGLLLTVLIISAPPIAATFFQGVLGSFTPYVAFGAGSSGANTNYPPGQGPVSRVPYSPPTNENVQRAARLETYSPVNVRVASSPSAVVETAAGRYGQASQTRSGPMI